MNRKITIILILVLLILTSISACLATNNNNELMERQKVETINYKDVEKYRNNINNNIEINQINYKLKNVEEIENKKKLEKSKRVTKEIITKSNDKYDVLNEFKQELNIEEDGYNGILKIDNTTLKIQPNDTYQEEYKVYCEEKYEDVKSNELNNIPKTIEKDGMTYYLTNPIWRISKVQEIDGQEVPILYDGIMKYEAIKERTVINNYIATVQYSGKLEKEIVDTVTFKLTYQEEKNNSEENEKNNVILPVTSGTVGFIVLSGIFIRKRKNVKIYNWKNEKYKLVKRISLNSKINEIDITPINSESNKYKIKLSNILFKKLKGKGIKIKYFDKQFIYKIDSKEFELLM